MTGTTTANLNLRKGAGTIFAVLTVIPEGTTVPVTGLAKNGWYPVTYNGASGWVSGAYLTVTAPPAVLTVSQGIARFFDALLPLLGLLYKIGGNGPTTFDCSGLVLFVLRLLGFPGSGPDRTADSMMHEFRAGRWKGTKVALADARPGDIAFFGWAIGGGDHHAGHVVFMVSPGYCIGSNGGSDQTDTPQEAIDRNAKVRIDKSNYRETAPWPHKNDLLEIWRPDYGWKE